MVDARLKFFDNNQLGTPRVGTTRDHTSATGAFSVVVAPSTYDINFTSVSNSFTVSTGKVYTTDGTIDATLIPLSNQTGNITVHVTF